MGYKLKKIYIGTQIVRPVPATVISLDKVLIGFNTVGQTSQITATLTPPNSTSTVSWTSSNTSIATVSTTGLVTCVTPGSCTITATTDNGLTATCSVVNGWSPGVNTLAWYPLETDTKDYSGNGRDGTNSNVTFSGGIATFNGSNAMVSIPDASWNRPTSNFTVSVWARPTSWTHTENGADYGIVTKQQYYAQDRPNFYYGIYINPSYKVAGGFATGNSYSYYPGVSSTSVSLNSWHLYTLTNNGNTKTLYLDGTQIGQASSTTTSSTYNIPLTIGNFYKANHDGYFNGNISNVILENKTRTATDITNYYNQTKYKYGL